MFASQFTLHYTLIYAMADSPDAPSSEHVKPREVPYCGFCSLPPEYCEFGPTLDK